MNPNINTHYFYDECAFEVRFYNQPNFKYNIHDYLIPSLGLPKQKDGHPSDSNIRTESVGFIAVLSDRKWLVKEVDFSRTHQSLFFFCRETEHIQMDAMAYPIDPSMTRDDIEGDSFPEANAAGTAWLFKHTRPGTHDDFERILHAIAVATFSGQMEAVILKCITATNRTAKRTAQRRVASWQTLRADVIAEAKKIHRANVLGHYHRDPHPSTGHYYAILSAAVSSVKAKWKAAVPKGTTFSERYNRRPQ